MAGVIQGRVLVAGAVEGAALASTEPLSFWGGYDQTSGEIMPVHSVPARNVICLNAPDDREDPPGIHIRSVHRNNIDSLIGASLPKPFIPAFKLGKNFKRRCEKEQSQQVFNESVIFHEGQT